MQNSNKIYSASDFASARISVLVEDCYWQVDAVGATATGSVSGLPLFEVQFKRLIQGTTATGLPEGMIDRSADLQPNRTYFIREGRPLFNDLSKIWKGVEGDREVFERAALAAVTGAYKGHVTRLSGVQYTKKSRDNSRDIQKTSLELWYPEWCDQEIIMDDFIALCNKGVYCPIIEKPAEKQVDLNQLDPAVIAAVMAALGKK